VFAKESNASAPLHGSIDNPICMPRFWPLLSQITNGVANGTNVEP